MNPEKAASLLSRLAADIKRLRPGWRRAWTPMDLARFLQSQGNHWTSSYETKSVGKKIRRALIACNDCHADWIITRNPCGNSCQVLLALKCLFP